MQQSQQYKEQQLLATMFVCNQIIRKETDHFVALFESVTGAYGEVKPEQVEQFNAVDYANFQTLGDNKYAYLKSVQQFVEDTTKDDFTQLNESQSIDNFKLDLANAIKQFESINDFNVLDNLSDEVLKIKLFARKPINVLGFNIMEVLEKNDNKMFGDIFSILYNKIDKVLYFVINGHFTKYDVATNNFTTVSDNRIDQTKYLQFFKQVINPNIVEIWKEPKITIPNMSKGFTDNLFGDVARTKEIEQIIKNQQQFMQR